MQAVNTVNCALTGNIMQTIDGKGIDALCTSSLWYAAIDTLYRGGGRTMNNKNKVR
jgi:hypothetical protein